MHFPILEVTILGGIFHLSFEIFFTTTIISYIDKELLNFII